MANTTRDYQAWKLRKLSDPTFAKAYINDILRNSPELFLTALKNVVQALDVSNVARKAGVARENIYRAFSPEGNPTWDTLKAVMLVVGVDFDSVRLVGESLDPSIPPPVMTRAHRRRVERRTVRVNYKNSRSGLEQFGQQSLPFTDAAPNASASGAVVSSQIPLAAPYWTSTRTGINVMKTNQGAGSLVPPELVIYANSLTSLYEGAQ